MNRGIRLSFMRVNAFRGIRDPVELDLTSPITLVFAPNGTGKTTLCEAAEWLLTGQVDRLREGKDFDPAVLKSNSLKEIGSRALVLTSCLETREGLFLEPCKEGRSRRLT